jgi:hypothetical protein
LPIDTLVGLPGRWMTIMKMAAADRWPPRFSDRIHTGWSDTVSVGTGPGVSVTVPFLGSLTGWAAVTNPAATVSLTVKLRNSRSANRWSAAVRGPTSPCQVNSGTTCSQNVPVADCGTAIVAGLPVVPGVVDSAGAAGSGPAAASAAARLTTSANLPAASAGIVHFGDMAMFRPSSRF